MRRHPHSRALELAVVKESHTRRECSNDGCGLMARPGKDGRRARLVVILEKARQPILVVESRFQMAANGAGIGMAQAIVQPLVVAVVEALLLQFPFVVPIGLGQKSEAPMSVAHGRDRLGPKWRRCATPGTLEDLRQ